MSFKFDVTMAMMIPTSNTMIDVQIKNNEYTLLLPLFTETDCTFLSASILVSVVFAEHVLSSGFILVGLVLVEEVSQDVDDDTLEIG